MTFFKNMKTFNSFHLEIWDNFKTLIRILKSKVDLIKNYL